MHPISTPPSDALTTLLQDRWGYSTFRPYQREIIEAVLLNTSLLAILPTAAGKSLTYQLPALVLPGLTLVITPLVALMEDQVRECTHHGLRAAAWHSQQLPADHLRLFAQLQEGTLQILFIAPERAPALLDHVRPGIVRRLVIDEAHCCSQWGHDFRPDYRRLPALRRALGDPPVLALTATAPPAIAADIRQLFACTLTLQAPSDRPNLAYGVLPVEHALAQQQALHQWLDRLPSGLVLCYTTSRKETETWAAHLQRTRGESVSAYHAGLPAETRRAAQAAFTSHATRILVATTAFGMGINLPDIRAVIHLGLPESAEAYLQESGRAGRDGAPAWALILPRLRYDFLRRRRLIEQAAPDPATFATAWTQLAQTLPPWQSADPATRALLLSLQTLAEDQGWWDPLHQRWTTPLTATIRDRSWAALQTAYHRRWTQWQALTRYLQTSACRRAWLLSYLQEPALAQRPPVDPCCDHCHPDRFLPAPSGVAAPTAWTVAWNRAQRSPQLPRLTLLRQWRDQTATHRGLAPQVILPDTALIALSQTAPDSLDALRRMPDVPAATVDRYGTWLLTVAPPPSTVSPPLVSVDAPTGLWCRGHLVVIPDQPVPQWFDRLWIAQSGSTVVCSPEGPDAAPLWTVTGAHIVRSPQRFEATQRTPSRRLLFVYAPDSPAFESPS